MSTDFMHSIQILNLPKRFEEKLLRDMKYLLSMNIPELKKIILFGSCARKTMRVKSDVDLLILLEKGISRQLRGQICSDLEEPLDFVSTDVVFYTEEEFQQSIRIFTKQVKQEGILLYERKE